MMDLNNGWFETLTYPIIDHQQHTCVTKHDLNLLHKKIIATDLIVQKYQDANKALIRLQNENDDLKQQIEQITNECCIFGKQVTECTQECDHLKEEIEMLKGEKREMNQQLRLLQDENTSYHHEVMVLRQFESLKDTNEQLTKTVERQNKQISKLQLQLQRQSPVVYKPTTERREPSETDMALNNSRKSVRELKLALARLMNFIQVSQIEVPAALHIRPILKAHDINDDFLEVEGEFVLQPVTKVVETAIVETQTVNQDDDDDDDDNDDDFVSTVTTTNIVTKVSEVPTKSSSQQQMKKNEVKQPKKSIAKSRHQKKKSKSPSKHVDELASTLEKALSQSSQHEQQSQHMPTLASFLSEDEDDDKMSKSDQKQTSSTPIYNPLNSYTSALKSTITVINTPSQQSAPKNNMPLLSDDDTDEISHENTPQPSSISMPYADQQLISSMTSDSQQKNYSLQTDSITPMDVETMKKPTTYVSCLSEDDDDMKSLTSSSTILTPQPSVNQEYISAVDVNTHTSTLNIYQPTLSIESEHENNALDQKHIEVVRRLLNFLIRIPNPLKPLEPIQCRRRRKSDKTVSENNDNIKIQEQITLEQVEQTNKPIVAQNNTTVEILIGQNTMPIEEQSSSTIEPDKTQSQIVVPIEIVTLPLEPQTPMTVEEQPKANADNTHVSTVVPVPIVSLSKPIQEPSLPTHRKEQDRKRRSVVSTELPKQVLLKPCQISIVRRLLKTLTSLPVKPLILPMPYPLRKRKRKIIANKPNVVLPRTVSNRTLRSSTSGIKTRSIKSIQARIARCNQPTTTISRKRTATESMSSLPPIPKRLKPTTRTEASTTNNDRYDLINKFLNSNTKEINDELKQFLQAKLQDDILLLNDNVYRIFSDFMFSKCDVILTLVNELHSYEESIHGLLVYIHSQSPVFQKHFITKLRQTFELEIKQQPISNNRIKILNRLFILTCSVFPTSPVIIYARLFDIGYHLSLDILSSLLSLIKHRFSSLLSVDTQTKSSNILFHQTLFDIFKEYPINISHEYVQNLLIAYHKYTHDQEDLVRCFILIARHRTWLWCSTELCSKLFIPLLNEIDEHSSQRIMILIILRCILFIFKDNDDLKRDHSCHNLVKKSLESLKNLNGHETTVRDQIRFILCSGSVFVK